MVKLWNLHRHINKFKFPHNDDVPLIFTPSCLFISNNNSRALKQVGITCLGIQKQIKCYTLELEHFMEAVRQAEAVF
jgi:hypothetical protein